MTEKGVEAMANKWQASAARGVITIHRLGTNFYLTGTEGTGGDPAAWEELITDANRTAALRVELDLKEEELSASRAGRDREYDRAEKLATELEQLRAAQPPPESADVARLCGQLAAARLAIAEWKARAQSAEHAADVANVRCGDHLEGMFKAQEVAARMRGRAEKAEAAVEGLRAKVDDLHEELDAAKRATNAEDDFSEPLTLNLDPNGAFFLASIWCGACREEDDLFISGISVDREEAQHLAELVRCYNLVHHDTDGTPEGEAFDRALKTAGEKLRREESQRAASAIFPEPADDLKRGLAASIIYNVISGKDRKPPATVSEAVDRATAPILSRGDDDARLLDWLAAQSSYGSGWICRPSTSGRGWRLHETSGEDASGSPRAAIREAMKRSAALREATKAAAKAGDGEISNAFREKMEEVLADHEPAGSWDRTMAQALDAQVGGQAQSLPVEGEIGRTCGAVSPPDEKGQRYICDRDLHPQDDQHIAHKDGKPFRIWTHKPSPTDETCPGSVALVLHGGSFTCGHCGARGKLVNGRVPKHTRARAPKDCEADGEVGTVLPERPVLLGDRAAEAVADFGRAFEAAGKPHAVFERKIEQGTGERILEVREAEHEEGAELHSFYERWPEDFAVAVPAGDGRLLINGEPPATPVRVLAECNYQTAREAVNRLSMLPVEGNALAAIAAEESRLRMESLAIPSFSDGALWMWKLLTGREQES